MDFVNGGLAGVGATVFTNPIDVVKTRMQLQGELQPKDKQTLRDILNEGQVVRYRGMFHALFVIGRTDGLSALQKGLAPALILGFTMNSVRLGMYHVAEVHGWTKKKNGEVSVNKAVFWSSVSGILSGVIANPVSVLKTRIQASAHPSIAVGRQHRYKGMFDGMSKIYHSEGFKGYFAGVNATCTRLAVGSAAQLTTFSAAKETLASHGICENSPFWLAFAASAVSGAVVALAMCPFDVTTVRLYNQGSLADGGLLYTGVFDALTKIYKTEGLHGLYKGLGPLYIRITPHTTLSLVIWDMLNLYTIIDFVNGGLAGAGASVFTNPLDVVKIRMQLQGELQPKHQQVTRYRSTLHALYVIASTDGVLALQRGLVPAVFLGLTMNSVRLGIFRVADARGWTRYADGEISVFKAAFWSALTGVLGGLVANPSFVIKTRMQAAAHPSIAVGKQHEYKGMLDGISKIYRTKGFSGFFAGVNATCSRVAVGSSAQLTTFSAAKEVLLSHGICEGSPMGLAFIASAVSGAAVAVAMCPLDVTSTRLYNQGPSEKEKLMYAGVLDALTKIYKTEGLHGLYKGFWPLYFRMSPHTTISLVLWDMLNIYAINKNS